MVGCWFFAVVVDWLLLIVSGWLLVDALAISLVVVCLLLVLGGSCWLVVGSCMVDSRCGRFLDVVGGWLLVLHGRRWLVADR